MIALLVAAAVSMIFTLLLTPLFARAFRRLNLGQFIRADTPTTHVVKRGTPSMGGVIFISASVIGYFLGKLVAREQPSMSALLVILMMVGLGFVGFIDDFLKVRRKNSLGLRGPYKIVGSTIVAIIFSVIALNHRDAHDQTAASTAISFVRDIPGLNPVAAFGAGIGLVIIIAWIILITTSVSNAVNLADGLDGLAGGSSILAIGSYVVICFWQNKQSCFGILPVADQAKCYDVSRPLELAVIAAAIVGAVIGFLWWNTSPAQITMGDTGSFGLGGALAALAILSRTELLLVLIGGLFLVVTGQVIVQRLYFKATKGKRIWRASPLHHHFEMKGWPEVTIVVRFWIISGLFVAAAVGIFYIEWVLHS
ncbi:phospho-N-acetylmuramoyl-pentapeptide-transferase [Parafrigoribacterium soli]|uniref:phospho-N-acetylmuramoyl-pentapeptide- transferase n=1 Tax=Parafrigoribacterium soli TaxID=3144663 RepID=UPI0032EC33F6